MNFFRFKNIGSPRSCRVCGCTNRDCRECIARTGRPCFWVDADLCSACHKPGFPVSGMLDPMSGRFTDWMKVFGTAEVPLLSPVVRRATTPLHAGVNEHHPLGVDVLLCDVPRLRAAQRVRLYQYLANKFNKSPEQAAADLAVEGLPILADDLYVNIIGPLFYCPKTGSTVH